VERALLCRSLDPPSCPNLIPTHANNILYNLCLNNEIRNAYTILVGKPDGKRPHVSAVWRRIFRKQCVRVWIGFNWLMIRPNGWFLWHMYIRVSDTTLLYFHKFVWNNLWIKQQTKRYRRYDDVWWCDRIPTFRRILLPPSSAWIIRYTASQPTRLVIALLGRRY
jgi:hypothetical protein